MTVDESSKVERESDDVLLRVENLVHQYPARGMRRYRGSDVKAVDSVSLTLTRGSTLAIVGETGSGKSTLARNIIQQPRPVSGSVIFNGRDLTQLRGDELRGALTGVSMVFQDAFASLDPRWTVLSLVEEPLKLQGIPKRERSRRACELLEFVGLPPDVYRGERPARLSGGQCQRVAIARSLISDPLLLIADEPVSSLDVSVQAQVINLFLRIQAEFRVAILFISHDLSVVRHLSHRVLVLYAGHTCEIGAAADVISDPRHPYSAGLLNAVPGADWAGRWEDLRPRSEQNAIDHVDHGCWYETRCPRAQDVCRTVPPELTPFGQERQAACHFPVGAD